MSAPYFGADVFSAITHERDTVMNNENIVSNNEDISSVQNTFDENGVDCENQPIIENSSAKKRKKGLLFLIPDGISAVVFALLASVFYLFGTELFFNLIHSVASSLLVYLFRITIPYVAASVTCIIWTLIISRRIDFPKGKLIFNLSSVIGTILTPLTTGIAVELVNFLVVQFVPFGRGIFGIIFLIAKCLIYPLSVFIISIIIYQIILAVMQKKNKTQTAEVQGE